MMSSKIPDPIKIYHIVHIDKLPSILEENGLICDAEIRRRCTIGTNIGMGKIKKRRLEELTLTSYPSLHVGDCVPFYFCPRSVMLYMFYKDNHEEIDYHGGQEPIIHLVADMQKTIDWAKENGLSWVFTTSNAGSKYFDDFCEMDKLDRIDWDAVHSIDWRQCRDKKQAEFLLENKFPWKLVESIGVFSNKQYQIVTSHLSKVPHRPTIQTQPTWYY